jgi:hypothetical protein
VTDLTNTNTTQTPNPQNPQQQKKPKGELIDLEPKAAEGAGGGAGDDAGIDFDLLLADSAVAAH